MNFHVVNRAIQQVPSHADDGCGGSRSIRSGPEELIAHSRHRRALNLDRLGSDSLNEKHYHDRNNTTLVPKT